MREACVLEMKNSFDKKLNFFKLKLNYGLEKGWGLRAIILTPVSNISLPTEVMRYEVLLARHVLL